jgi:flagellar basal-body rod protein FlgB
MVQEIFGSAMQSVEAALNVRSLRQDLLASNIANAETPGYRALDVDFEATMQEVLGQQDYGMPSRMGETGQASRPLMDALQIVGDDSNTIGNSQNTVDVDRQMAHLEENGLMFQVTAQIAGMRFAQLKQIVTEGGRNG